MNERLKNTVQCPVASGNECGSLRNHHIDVDPVDVVRFLHVNLVD